MKIGRGAQSYNYYVLRDLIDQEIIDEIRAVGKQLPDTGGTYSKSGDNRMSLFLDQMPKLVALLPQIFDDLHVIGSNFFISEPCAPDAENLGAWHTGHSLYFGVNGVAMTLWIPLQDLDDSTGGRLKMYNGKLIPEIDRLLDEQVKMNGNSISNKHSILQFFNSHLEEEKCVDSLKAGDVLLFDEMLPHGAETCSIHREVFALRLVIGDYSLNRPLIEQTIERYRSQPGECDFAVEYLENLLAFEEYPLDGKGPKNPTQEKWPEPSAMSTLKSRVKKLLKKAA